MATQPWLDKVQRQLAENGLPPIYIRRFMDELSDHFEDLMEETMNKETNSLSQLGDPNEIASAATIAYRQRTFFGRHPIAKFLVFGVSPMFTMVFSFWSVYFLWFLVAMACKLCGVNIENTKIFGGIPSANAVWGISLLTTIVPATLLTLLYCTWAKRSKLTKRWMLVSCVFLAIPAMMLFQGPTCNQLGQECWTIGLRPPVNSLHYIQMLVPLAVGIWFMRRTYNQQIDTDGSLQAAM